MKKRSASVSLDAMWEHIESLAAQHSIKINTRLDRPADSFAVLWARTICIAPLRSAVGYATALHEMAHIVLGWSQDDAREIEQERDAWEWATLNAIVWTRAMERCASRSLAEIRKKRQAGKSGDPRPR